MSVFGNRRPYHPGLLLALAGALPFLVASHLFAEVLALPCDNISVGVLVGVIGEGPDPIPGIVWQIFRPLSDARILNPSGELRGDGMPEFTSQPLGGGPIAVWAYQNGPEHDIALAEWSGGAWTPTSFLTSGASDDLDPVIATEPNGTVHIVWWRPGAVARILHFTRLPGQFSWSEATEVTTGGRSARRPSVTFHAGTLRIAYERTCADLSCAQEIVVATQGVDGDFAHEVIGQTARPDRLDVQIHAESATLWVEWKDDSDCLGHARLETAGWSAVGSTTLAGPSWLEVLDTRRTVRRVVLCP